MVNPHDSDFARRAAPRSTTSQPFYVRNSFGWRFWATSDKKS